MVDFLGAVCEAIAQRHGIFVNKLDIRSWCGTGDPTNPLDNLTCFGPGRTWWDFVHDNPRLWADADPINGALGTIDWLRAHGYYLEALSAKPDDWNRQVTWEWLGYYKPDFHRVTLVDQAEFKPNATAADILIDDSEHGGNAWLDSGRDLIVFAQPWNTNAVYDCTKASMYRAETWNDVPALLALIEFLQEAECYPGS